MQQSMTGFCNLTEAFNNKLITIDLRCLNSKVLDINLRLPNFYKELENEIRKLTSKHLLRGKIDITISIEWLESAHSGGINKALFKQYFNTFVELKQELKLENYQPDWFSVLLRLPDVVQMSSLELSDEEKFFLLNILEKAYQQVVQFRFKEGSILIDDILKRIEQIEKFLGEIEFFEEQRIVSLKQRIYNHLKEFLNDVQIDKNRLEQELIYYIEKMDITEEKVRIHSHCNYFRDVAQNEQNAGKKLSFIAQELGREINTLGSKSQDFNMQRIVVQMKDELEKIKEQLLNIL